jgi:hypothetical protein
MEPGPWFIPCIFVVAVPAEDGAEDEVGAEVAAPRATVVGDEPWAIDCDAFPAQPASSKTTAVAVQVL